MRAALHSASMVLLVSGTSLMLSCGGDSKGTPDSGPSLPAWSRELPNAAISIGVRRGLSPARGIVHLHSPYSHDACDGDPRENETGPVNEPCLADLKRALCDTRMDFAALTDHDDTMADEDFDTLFSVRAGDERVPGKPAARWACDNGHRVLVTVGSENNLMPIMLDDHVEGDVSTRHDTYNGESPENIAAMRAAGALIWVNHAEQETIERIRTVAPDGLEIYQLHANIDPDIRKDFLGLSTDGAIRAVVEFADTTENGPEPDLALLAFLEPNTPALAHWDTLLGEGLRFTGTGGTDAHQNALPILLRDGERGDSYRRMLRWFSNVVLVADPTDPTQIKAAVAGGRMFVAFEMFGTPAGFDASASAGATTYELGDELTTAEGATLSVTLPTVYQLDASLPAPVIRARILRVDATGTHEVAVGNTSPITAQLDQVGAYRVEILITGHHLGPYMRRLGTTAAEREHVWIYANPIYVRAPI